MIYVEAKHESKTDMASPSPSLKIEFGPRGFFLFTWKEFRTILALAITLLTSGVGYVIRCEVKFAVMQAQIDNCKRTDTTKAEAAK